MTQCDMCGKETKLIQIFIEGTKLYVCKDCSKFGKVIDEENSMPDRKLTFKISKKRILEDSEIIIPNFNQVIKKKRELMGIKQKELAEMIAEKESVINKIESGSLEPPLKLAKKLEKKLGIELITKAPKKEAGKKEVEIDLKKVTIGDIIKLKKNN